MKIIRGQFLSILLTCLGLVSLCFVPIDLCAKNIALFFDSNYVDIQDGNIFSEASNLKETLEYLGHELVYFTDFETVAHNEFDLVIIPEMEKQNLSRALNDNQFNHYKSYVENGGSIIIMGVVSSDDSQNRNSIDFINRMLGSNAKLGEPILDGTCIKHENVTDGDFSVAPDELNNNNAVVYIESGLPANSRIIYHSENNTNEGAVVQFPFGKGNLVYFGWGWWNAKPLGSQDGGWLSLLDSSVESFSCFQPQLYLDEIYTLNINLSGSVELDESIFSDQFIACANTELTLSQDFFSCGDVRKEHQVEVYLQDDLGRLASQTIKVVITDDHEVCEIQPLSIQMSLSFETLNSEGLSQVLTAIGEENPLLLESDQNGNLLFAVQEEEELLINLDKQTTFALEVTTNDLRMLERHVLRLQTFKSPYQYIAADVNGDKKLDISDIAIMRKIILHNEITADTESNWLWIDKDFKFEDGADPLMHNWNTIQNSTINSSNTNLNILGIKLGDIDASF